MKGFAKRIKEMGGTVYIVGGYVRDSLRGKQPNDKDFVVTGITEDMLLTAYPKAEKVGKSFPVYLIKVDNELCEIALARTEEKTGTGYTGFTVRFDPGVTIEEDLTRRDTTMNSIALDILSGQLIDPFYGVHDIRTKTIRATSNHFKDDPVRALRAARQAAQFKFMISTETYMLMCDCKEELKNEPTERFVKELEKALRCDKPSLYFRALKQAGILDAVYPQIYDLIGQTQPPKYHPEGDAFEHSMLVLDEVAALTDRVEVRFAALVHDLGKGLTDKSELPHHKHHDDTGVTALASFDRCMTLPSTWLKCGRFAIENHMRAMNLVRCGKIVELLNQLSKNPIGIDGFTTILSVDSGSVPSYLADYDKLIKAIKSVSGSSAPAQLKGKQIGDWLFQEQIRAFRACYKK